MKKTSPLTKTNDAIKILKRRIGDDPQFWETVAEERLNCEIAHLIYEARNQAGLTQAQLAQRLGTQQPVIARLEDANYNGHSLRMLQRIAQALNLHLKVRMEPNKRQTVKSRRSLAKRR